LTKVLNGLQEKKVLLPETILELEEFLKDRDTASADTAASPAPENTRLTSSRSKQPTPSSHKSSGHRPDKRQIEQRIEEDRERHKRLRESIWAVNSEDNKEFERLWEDTSDIGEDDFLNAEEDAYERQRAVRELDYNALVGNAVAAAEAAEKEKLAASNGASAIAIPAGVTADNA
jgi:CTD kinase subunit gamma